MKLGQLENTVADLQSQIQNLKDEDQSIKSKMMELNKETVVDINQKFSSQIRQNGKMDKLLKHIQTSLQRAEQVQSDLDMALRR